MPDHTRELAGLAERLRRICGDDRVRRELLWLRAQEKEDDESRALLERADPGLAARMARMVDAMRLDEIDDPHERREAFGRLYDERSWTS